MSLAPHEPRPARRRRPEDVRTEALAIARRLLVRGGPGAVTFKAIGGEMGMSHANLIHHFGSAEGLQARLRAELVGEVAAVVRDLLEAHARGEAKDHSIVDRVFDAYAGGGLGVLTAWSALSRAGDAETPPELSAAIEQLVPVLEATVPGADAAARAREVLRMVTLLAFAESLIGPFLPRARQGEAGDPRAFTRRLLHLLALEPAVAPGAALLRPGDPAND